MKEATKKTRGLEAPLACAQAVRNAVTLSFDAALEKEHELFLHLVAGVQSRAQRHLFFAEREAAKVAGVGKDVAPREIRKVGIIGAGTMGGGIAMAFANGGFPVTVLEASAEALERGFAGKLILIAEDNLGPSDCRVEWADGGAERLYERLFAQIEMEFAKAIAVMQKTIETDTE